MSASRSHTSRNTESEPGCSLTAQETRVIQVYRNPLGWLQSLTQTERDDVWLFVFGESRVIPECLAQALGQDRQRSRRIVATQGFNQPVLIGA